jgi:hypothetical protein
MPKVKLPAVIVAALSYWILGFVWYGVLFAKQFISLMGFSEQQVKEMESASHIRELTIVVVCALVLAYVLACFISVSGVRTMLDGIKIAVLAWLGFVLTTNLESVLFEARPLGLYVLNNAYHLVGFVLMSVIISAWGSRVPVKLAYET